MTVQAPSMNVATTEVYGALGIGKRPTTNEKRARIKYNHFINPPRVEV